MRATIELSHNYCITLLVDDTLFLLLIYSFIYVLLFGFFHLLGSFSSLFLSFAPFNGWLLSFANLTLYIDRETHTTAFVHILSSFVIFSSLCTHRHAISYSFVYFLCIFLRLSLSLIPYNGSTCTTYTRMYSCTLEMLCLMCVCV